MNRLNPALPRGILTFEGVVAIKHALWNGKAQVLLAKEYGVTQATISNIMRGKSWSGVEWPDGSIGPIILERKISLDRRYEPITDDTPPTLEAEAAAMAVEKRIEQQEKDDEDELVNAIRRGTTRKTKS